MDNRRAFLVGAVGVGAVAGVLGGVPASAAGGGDDPYSVDVMNHGADPTGARPSDAAFRAAAAEVLASFQGAPISGAVPKKVLVVPPGNYLLTQPDSLLPNVDGGVAGSGGIVDGISITGYGKRLSRITYSPTADDTTLWTNRRRYKNIRISGLTFVSTNPTSSFNYAVSDNKAGVQDTWYTDVEWRGDWTRGIGLDSPTGAVADLNSEMGWDHCQIGGSYSDAFLVIGMTPATAKQDQFLNYWFRECKVEFQSGVFVRNARGGSMNFIGGSYVLIDESKPGTFFKLDGTAGRADSVARLYAQGIRFELRCALHKVIDSSWYKGHISFVSCDDTANAYQDFAADAVSHSYAFTASGSRGPMVRYVDCALLGRHEVRTGTAPITAGKVVYDGSRFANRTAAGILGWVGGATPRHEYRDCLAGGAYLADEKKP
ncbi:hypothetical protein AB0M43_04810 [Longispora sp. NPDC051575]|uniref:hypothetical protein n=1 Tax=Longispora sp. NPDC051575 TaxID=3154943 RepID=UPI003434912F